ncbi:MAG: wax ester/triacylglycerol synthase family O-acyltransferase [Myxococcota bacterium]|jgi:diacylglycerol O-acyltransferase / wax synthase|nr:wax ester/triacylglycerol synthase family O-acyltransferase [Myxococcota bacterium]
MSNYKFERLSAQDNSFLLAETPHAPLHVTAVGIYDAGDLSTGEGGVDFRMIKRSLEARLHRIPRYRQKLMWVPFENRAVWVDDDHFNIDYHLRHSALPHPGGLEQLKNLTARISTQPLDRARPLWEMWIIEGLSENRFAMVSKIHHCMIDGASGSDVAQILMSTSPEQATEEPQPFLPRPAPSRRELLIDAAIHQVSMPLRALESLSSYQQTAPDIAEDIGEKLGALAGLAKWAVSSSSPTPINGELGPHRRIDWLALPLADVKTLRSTLKCSVNDVVLATVTGAMRHYFLHRGVDPKALDFRISAPVNVRQKSEEGKLGNRVSTWIVPLPLATSNPLEWVERIRSETAELKESHQAQAFDMLMSTAEYLPASLLALGARAAEGPINMIVTNVQGPPFPLYLLGAKLLEMNPIVPLLNGTGLGIALFSYDGRLHIGLNADYELVPDLGILTALLAQSFMTLVDAADAREQHQQAKVPPAKSATAKKAPARPPKRKHSGKAPLQAVARASGPEPH